MMADYKNKLFVKLGYVVDCRCCAVCCRCCAMCRLLCQKISHFSGQQYTAGLCWEEQSVGHMHCSSCRSG